MAKHTAYILSDDARAQAEFYTQALGGEIVSVMTHGAMPEAAEEWRDKVIHLHMIGAGVNFYMSDSVFSPVHYGSSLLQNLEFSTDAEAHEAFDRLAEGGTVQFPLEPAFWGTLHGQLQDKFGVLWMITTEVASAR
ncbi:glyoxalase/bleomycin resistance/extradiol dioxygenase family protein [Paenibacillus athensensis]|uniref:Glyoxalase/fosfomycin resistance/dioxygenase domain-containing protein n=1 Tax=Paenibacillus athensensis TaxID=1967502 RepID=A0A4Y8Q149_9BACL|nr:glyoxalase/bleomycin resistance/extradiol dioxygenase family protein [Paenibacillus athensensis]MCD1260622.1 glyoxalase/bleomycin resistance/extradiol dioxygenase family protein [Paenibacillus athensensis]